MQKVLSIFLPLLNHTKWHHYLQKDYRLVYLLQKDLQYMSEHSPQKKEIMLKITLKNKNNLIISDS